MRPCSKSRRKTWWTRRNWIYLAERSGNFYPDDDPGLRQRRHSTTDRGQDADTWLRAGTSGRRTGTAWAGFDCAFKHLPWPEQRTPGLDPAAIRRG